MTPKLDRLSIQRAIQTACDHANNRLPATFHFKLSSEIPSLKLEACSESSFMYLVDVRSVCHHLHDDNSKADDELERTKCSFYFSYSTWDGRVLYVDEMGSSTAAYVKEDSLSWLIRQMLAHVAIQLDCARLVWHHNQTDSTSSVSLLSLSPSRNDDDDDDVSGTSATTTLEAHKNYNMPQILDGWLTLRWETVKMKEFLSSNGIDLPNIATEDSHLLLRNGEAKKATSHIINQCLQVINTSGGQLRLRLATAIDVDHIERLVHGLALFEKEPESVHISKEDFLRDGFMQPQPLYFCFLIDHIEERISQPQTIGIALCYFGWQQTHGRFIHLEDLFIEHPYRGFGGGTLVMRALAVICLSLHCSHLRWQALHWNTPALTFYAKIGATIQNGLLTIRYNRQELDRFRTHWIECHQSD